MAPTPGVTPAAVTPSGAAPPLTLPKPTPGKAYASVPTGHPCATVHDRVMAAQAAGDPAAFQAALAQWSSQCAAYNLWYANKA